MWTSYIAIFRVENTGIFFGNISAINTAGNNVSLDGSTIASNSKIVIKVSTPLDKSTVNANKIYITKGDVREAISVDYDKATGEITIESLASDKFEGGKSYTLTLTKDIKTAEGTALAQDLTYNFSTAANPVVLSTSDDAFTTTISSGAVVDANNTELSVKFNKDMDTTTFNATNVKFYDITDGKYIAVDVTSNGARQILVNKAAVGATIFATDHKYKLIVTTGVKDLGGVALGTDYDIMLFPAGTTLSVSNEKVADTTFVGFTATNVYNKLSPSAGHSAFKFLAQFDKDMDTTTFDGNVKFVEKTATGDIDVPFTVSYESGSRYINILPKADLKEDVQYEITLGEDIKTTEGLALGADKVYKVTTGDFTKPTFVSSTPANGAANVAIDGDIVLNFSEEMKASTLKLGTDIKLFSVTDSDASVDISGWLSSLSGDEKTLTITPDKTGANILEPNKTYKIELQKTIADKSTNANTFADKATIIFTTAQSGAPVVSTVKTGNYDSTGTIVANGVTKIDDDAKVYFNFDKNLDATYFNANKATLVKIEYKVNDTWTTATVGSGLVTAPVVSIVNNKSVLIDATGSDFVKDTNYRVTISSNLKEEFGTQLGNDYVFEFTTGTKPSVDSNKSYPKAFATDLGLETPYVAVVIGDADSNLDKSTLNVNTIKFTNKADGTDAPYTLKYVNEVKDVTSASTATITNGSKAVTLTAADANIKVGSILEIGTDPQVYVVTAIDVAGTGLTLDRNIVGATGPAKAVKVKSGVVYTLNTDAKLQSNTEYQIAVSGVKDKVGNPVDNTTITARTEIGSTDLELSSTSVADGATGVKVNAPLSLTFNTPIDASTISNIVINQSGVDVTSKFTVEVDDTNDKVVLIEPKGFLLKDTTYQIAIPTTVKNTAAYGADVLNSAEDITFHTEVDASVKPMITSAVYFDTNGNDKVDDGDVVRVTFNAEIDHATVNNLATDFAIAGPGYVAAGSTASHTAGDDYIDITLADAAGPINPSLAVGVSTIKVNTDELKDLFGNSVTTDKVTITAYK